MRFQGRIEKQSDGEDGRHFYVVDVFDVASRIAWMSNSRLNDLLTVIRLAPGLDKLMDEGPDEWIDVWESGCRSGRYTSHFK